MQLQYFSLDFHNPDYHFSHPGVILPQALLPQTGTSTFWKLFLHSMYMSRAKILAKLNGKGHSEYAGILFSARPSTHDKHFHGILSGPDITPYIFWAFLMVCICRYVVCNHKLLRSMCISYHGFYSISWDEWHLESRHCLLIHGLKGYLAM